MSVKKKQLCCILNTLGREKGFSSEVREEKDHPCGKSTHKTHLE